MSNKWLENNKRIVISSILPGDGIIVTITVNDIDEIIFDDLVDEDRLEISHELNNDDDDCGIYVKVKTRTITLKECEQWKKGKFKLDPVLVEVFKKDQIIGSLLIERKLI